MSDQAFERRFGSWLREAPGLWCYHPVDSPMARQWVPGDFIIGWQHGFGVLECKEVQGERFPLSRWTPQQRGHSRRVLAAGGQYILVVHFAPLRQVVAYRVNSYEQGTWLLLPETTGSLTPERGRLVTRKDLPRQLGINPELI